MKKYKLFILLVLISGICSSVQAELGLSVLPVSGANTVRFGRLSAIEKSSEEVRIRITSTDSNQYQVFQRVIDPFTNEKGATLGRQALLTYTLAGSNASGTLYGQNVEPMGFNDQLIYTSGQGGESDSLTVVYMIDNDRVEASGSFLARLQWTVRPIGGGGQETAILNASVDVGEEFKITVEGSTSPNGVRLAFGREREEEGYIHFSFEGNLGREIQIFQEVETYPQDELREELDAETLSLTVSGSEKGAAALPPAALTRRREQIYASTTPEDDFYVYFRLNKEAGQKQKSGTYRGKLRYVVASQGAQQSFDVDIEVQVDPVFSIKVDLPSTGMNFERLLPDTPPVLREIDVRVVTNLAKPYMVMQNVVTPLMNEKGEEMPEEQFTVKQELLDGDEGQVASEDFQPARKGEKPLYFSDRKGSPAHFRVIYRLRPYAQMRPGDYSTSIRYSLGEM